MSSYILFFVYGGSEGEGFSGGTPLVSIQTNNKVEKRYTHI